ncbi:hypothetical protein [Clavibacter michiganensis]|uniref:hypothetical protein n=1 Tax=Clavibacter michiganensis TaxID=28447 RepID=UPI0011B06FCD|nr:hypothetical protein [Clavibacter michiganensis]
MRPQTVLMSAGWVVMVGSPLAAGAPRLLLVVFGVGLVLALAGVVVAGVRTLRRGLRLHRARRAAARTGHPFRPRPMDASGAAELSLVLSLATMVVASAVVGDTTPGAAIALALAAGSLVVGVAAGAAVRVRGLRRLRRWEACATSGAVGPASEGTGAA